MWASLLWLARFRFYHDSPRNELVIKPRGGREKRIPPPEDYYRQKDKRYKRNTHAKEHVPYVLMS